MRSIRRSMTIYLFALLLITMAMIGVVIDRVTEEALEAREADGVELIETQYKQRYHEETQNTNDALLNQAQRLYGLIIEHNRIRWFKLTDQAFTALRNNVPETVLVKLDPLKDKEFSRGDLIQEIGRVLNMDETKQFQDIILNQAGIRRREELGIYRAMNDVAPLMFLTNPLAEAAWTAMGNAPNATIQDRIRWFKLTDQSLTALRNNVPKTVLVKLDPLKDKEFSRGDLIQEIGKVLSTDETKQFQDIIVNQAGIRRRDESGNHRILNDVAPLLFLTNSLAEAAWTATGNAPSATMQDQALFSTPSPTMDILSRMYFANLLPKEYMQHISETSTGTEYHQVNAVVGAGRGREWHSTSLDPRELPFDPKAIDDRLPDHGKPDSAVVWVYDDTTIAQDNEIVHRIIFRGTRQVFMPPPPRQGPPGPPPAPTTPGGVGSNPPQRTTGQIPNRPDRDRLPSPTIESRLYIQCARPKAEIDARLAAFENERNDARVKLAGDIKSARKNMLLQLAVVGLIAILAIAIGGPLIVGIGLRPVGKLSDAVSRVSERDFKLPHDGLNLVRELVPIHSRLTQTLDLLQRAFSREKQAVADISHELRTPIAALMATIDVSLRKPRTPEQYRSTLEECRLISKQLGQLVERIMTLASLDAGNDRTVIARTDAFELAAGCATVIRPLAAANGITLHLHPPEDLIELDTDPAKLREVLMNLLHNAVEYNRPNGTIDLTLRLEGSNVVFEVQDTGIGMTPEVKEKIFERFFRADPSRHATGVHAGLGLAIVKEYVTRLNGTIVVESGPGVGSLFRIVFPALPIESPPPFESAEPMVARP